MNQFETKLWSARLKELEDKKFIDRDQYYSLIKMLYSPDKENKLMFTEVCKSYISKKLSEGLNSGQKEAYDKMLEFIEDSSSHDAIVLRGYAGTGKTFLVKRVIEYIVQTRFTDKIAVSAPTNKAVHVLYKNSSGVGYVFEDIYNASSRIIYSTTHKLLGLKEVITDEGDQIFMADKLNGSELSSYKYLIVDEVSMLDDDLCKQILKYSSRCTIIFMGDPAQIPPINKQDSIPLRGHRDYKFLNLELTEIMRQKGDNPIVEASFTIRNNLLLKQPIHKLETKLNEKGQGIIHLDSEKGSQEVMEIFKKYFEDSTYKTDSDYVKVIAWRNNTIDYINRVIREIIYGKNLPRFIINEKLVVRKPVFQQVEAGRNKWKNWKIILNTSEEITVQKIDVKNLYISEGPYKITCKAYSLEVSSYNPMTNNNFIDVINVIHEDSQKDFDDLIAKVKHSAIQTKQASEWFMYYNLLKWTADVTYNYAISAHKSQGSTYKNVVILEDDIDQNRKTLERNRIKYTAYSRAAEKLYVFRKNSIES